MTDSRRALLVFTRTPEAEARAKGLEPERAARLFSAFLSSWRIAAEAAGARFVVSSPPRCAERFREGRLCEGAVVLEQSARPFGERLACAVDEVFALGFKSVSVVAGDAPSISGEELDLVFRALEERRAPVVVGPSRDGGVYLIGLSDAGSGFLADFSPRDPRLCAELESDLGRLGLPVVRLETRDELDSLADLKRVYGECATSPVWREFRFLLSAALRQRRPFLPDTPPRVGLCLLSAIPARAPPVV